jgi:6-phosphofructokinase 1
MALASLDERFLDANNAYDSESLQSLLHYILLLIKTPQEKLTQQQTITDTKLPPLYESGGQEYTLPYMNIGILNSGGDCPGLNAVIRAVVLAAKQNGDNKVYGFFDGFPGLYSPNGYRELQIQDVLSIERMGGTILGTSNKGDFGEVGLLKEPSAQALGTLEKIKQTKEHLQLDGLIVTGGDGSLRIAYWVGQNTGLNIIGIPKTIDNDLANTDITLGFNTAIATASDAIEKIRDTAQSMHRAMIVEVMGWSAGWIALESGIAGGADIILLPEIPYNLEKIGTMVKDRIQDEKHSVIIVIAEGSPEKNRTADQKSAGVKLSTDLKEKFGIESRVTILGYIQRGGEPSPNDKILGTRLGQKAVEVLLEGKENVFLSVLNNEVQMLPLSAASSETRLVPANHPMINMARGIGIYFGE